MEIRTLGPLEVLDGGEPVALGGRKQRALLAVLALSPGRAVSAARLIDDLWGEEAPDTAPKMVQIHVSQLRKVLPPDVLLTRAPGYQLDVAPAQVDAFRAEELLRAGREALASGDPRSASERLGEALALWRGPALAEFAEPFAAGEARRLEELHLALLEERIEAELALGRHAEVVGEIEAPDRPPAAARARTRPAHARAVPRRPPGRGAGRLPGGPPGAVGGARHRSLGRAARPGAADPAAGPRACPRPSSGAAARRPSARPPPRPARPSSGGASELAALRGHLGAARGASRAWCSCPARPARARPRWSRPSWPRPTARTRWSGRGQCVEQHGSSEAYMPVLEALDRLCRAPGGEALVPLLVERAPTWIAQMPWLVSPAELSRVQGRTVGATQERMLREIVEALFAARGRAPASSSCSRTCTGATPRRWRSSRRSPAAATPPACWSSPRSARPTRPPATIPCTRPSPSWCRAASPPSSVVGALGDDDVGEYLGARVPGAELPRRASGAPLAERTGGNPLFLEKAVDSWIEDGKVRPR